MYLRGAILAATVALVCVGSVAPSASATECDVDLCIEQTVTTNEAGAYRLVLTPGLIALIKPEIADCTWSIEGDLGDGTGMRAYPDFNAEVNANRNAQANLETDCCAHTTLIGADVGWSQRRMVRRFLGRQRCRQLRPFREPKRRHYRRGRGSRLEDGYALQLL